MAKYVIRLDDACPQMNQDGWTEMENLLDKYNITPLVGVIPDNRDTAFTWETNDQFWTTTISRWKAKDWSLAQHGCHHTITKSENNVYSEFVGKPYSEQLSLIEKGQFS